MADARRANSGSANAKSLDPDASHICDEALVAGICRGEQAALAEVYSRHAGAVMRLVRRLCSQTEAEEVCQDVFLRMWQRPERYDPDRGTVRGFLMMEARARAVDLIRSEAARRARERVDLSRRGAEGVEVDVVALARVTGHAMCERLGALPACERDAVVLAFFGNYTYREVAALLGEAEGTVKSRVRRALSRLRVDLAHPASLDPGSTARPDYRHGAAP